MNQLKPSFIKITFILAVVLLLLTPLTVLWGFNGLAGINPENHDKQLVYQVSQEAAETIWVATLIAVLISLIVTILAGLNFKFKNHILNLSLLAICGLLFIWVVFASWALDAEFIPKTDYSNPSAERGNNNLRIRTMNIN